MTQRDDFLKSQKIMRLATTKPDGRPHIIPVWYLYAAKKFYVGTNTKTVKAKNVKKDKRVAFCIDIGVNSPDIFGVMGQGNADIILDSKKVRKLAKKILYRYFDSLEEKSAVELLNDTDCIIEIIPEKISVWKY